MSNFLKNLVAANIGVAVGAAASCVAGPLGGVAAGMTARQLTRALMSNDLDIADASPESGIGEGVDSEFFDSIFG